MKRDLTYAEVGWRNARSLTVAMNALCFVVEYGQAVEDLRDEELKIEDYGDHVGLSRSQAFRRQAAFRSAYPGNDVLAVWKLVRPALKKSSFANEGSRKQALFVSTLHGGWTR